MLGEIYRRRDLPILQTEWSIQRKTNATMVRCQRAASCSLLTGKMVNWAIES
jgi:hypothetical protein